MSTGTSSKHGLSSPEKAANVSKMISTAIESSLTHQSNTNLERQSLSTGDAFDGPNFMGRSRISVPYSEQTRSNSAPEHLIKAQKLLGASDFGIKDSSLRRRPPILQRRSLLNEQVSFMSTTTSSDESSGHPSPDIKYVVGTGSPEKRRTDTPVWPAPLSLNVMSEQERGLHQELLTKHSPNIGQDLQALAIEQGGIPVSALSSPTYAQPSVSGMVRNTSLAPLSVLLEERLSNQNSALGSSSSFPQPLRAHPPVENQGTLHRSATLPTKSSRRPNFLPLPSEEPNSSTSFTRESVLSTPFPGSGFGTQRMFIPSNQPRSTISDQHHSSPQLSSVAKIPVILRDGRNCTSGVGKVELPTKILEKAKESAGDDYHFVKGIIREHQRLRGKRTYISARALASVRIVFKSHSRDFYTPSLDPNSILPDPSLNSATYGAEEGRAAAYIAVQRAVSRTASADASKRHLEESLSLLLKKPHIGRDSSTCSSDLRKLISEAARPDERGGPRGSLALEIVEGWDWFRIGIAVVCVLLSSMLTTLLWILLGVNETLSNAEDYHHVLIRPDPLMAVGTYPSYTGLGGPGSRLTGGATLGLFILLIGWSWIGFWMGMSWLVD